MSGLQLASIKIHPSFARTIEKQNVLAIAPATKVNRKSFLNLELVANEEDKGPHQNEISGLVAKSRPFCNELKPRSLKNTGKNGIKLPKELKRKKLNTYTLTGAILMLRFEPFSCSLLEDFFLFDAWVLFFFNLVFLSFVAYRLNISSSDSDVMIQNKDSSRGFV